MRTSKYLLATEKETPADAELISHRLMLRAGMIRKVAAGVYNWMPLGLRVLQKVERVVREEMNRADAIEILMPNIIPAELWQETGRWQKYGPELLRITDRHKREFCFGPTHEEVVTEIARKEIKSYKQLPLNLYQIQIKFRDEIRPRFGVMRGREFVMKDAYSFHTSKESLQQTYDVMYQTYSRIFTRLGLKFRAVEADTGSIGGNYSHEFQVLAEAGEDLIFYSDASNYAANIEQASALAPEGAPAAALETMKLIDTPNQRSIEDLAKNYNIPATRSVKTMIGKNAKGELYALILRGDHTLNEVKAKKLSVMHDHFELANEVEIRAKFTAGPGSLGPVNCPVKIFVDRDAAHLSDFACGANIDDKHYLGVNWGRDVKDYTIVDIRNVVVGDKSPDGKGTLLSARGIEVGHIFQLQDKYSKAMNCTVLDETGKTSVLQMGCYGIGVSRILGAAIEQHHDEKGIIWPKEMAPFQVALVALRYHDSDVVKKNADALYQSLIAAGIEVLLDDRNERPGVMFADMELIGIPHRLVVSERGLAQGKVEYKARTDTTVRDIAVDDALNFILGV